MPHAPNVSHARLGAHLFFEGGDRLPIFLNVQLAPGNHLRSHVECFTPLISDANGLERLPKQLGPKGIRVNGVAPGPAWTPLQISGGATEEKYEKFGTTTVFGRPGQPAELASTFVQLAAEDASFATGNIYGSGGGQGQP